MADRPALIVALDVPALPVARRMIEQLMAVTPWFKVGPVLFTSVGPNAVTSILAAGGKVFLDLKFHDIPNVVAGSVRAAADLGVSLVTVHCAGGGAMLEAASDGARRSGSPVRVLGVTRLTSEAGRVGASVLRAAESARAAGLGGVVAATRECSRIKARLGDEFHVLTPGIRPPGVDSDDQARVATPRQAVRAGADYLVVGRPITQAPNPAEAARTILDQIERAFGRALSAAHAAASAPSHSARL
jgi:orotidine-5'-phosphate decarboxylase